MSNAEPVAASISEIWPEVERIASAHHVIAAGTADLGAEFGDVFARWLDLGHEAGMTWLRRNREARRDPTTRFPWAKSAIVILVPYSAERPHQDDRISTRIARYALGDDYHDVLNEILKEIENAILRAIPDTRTRRYVDTGPLSDRTLAARAGLGWIGKNAMLIHPEHGSWTFIGALLTSLGDDRGGHEITDQCGTCTRCIDACPTQAILTDRTVDSGRCISYWTIEHRGPIEPSIASRIEGNLFGCDICNEACPWNASPPAPHPAFEPRDEYRRRPIHELLRIEQGEFSSLFRRSGVKRARRDGIIRNAILVTSAEHRDSTPTDSPDRDGT